MKQRARYILDPSEAERARLRVQADLYRPLTKRVLAQTGLGPGMRVMDVGTGTGDIAFMAADLVGPAGYVLGVNCEPSMVEAAQESALQRGLKHVAFEVGSMRPGEHGGAYDLVVGRFVLAHQPDPVGFLRNLATLVVPGGSVAFIETAFDLLAKYSNPPIPLFDEMIEKHVSFARKRIHHALGSNMNSVFSKAGLGRANLVADIPVGAHDSDVMNYMLLLFTSMRSALEAQGIDQPDAETLPRNLKSIRKEAESSCAQLSGWCVVGASAEIAGGAGVRLRKIEA